MAQGFSQVHGIDYTETFAPTIRRESLRIFLAIINMLGLILIEMHVIGAYLESALGQNKQPIFVKIPQGRQTGREELVYKILKTLYGLKQARRLWNKTIIKFFKKIGFNLTNADSCILVFRKKQLIIVGVYVDDLMLVANQNKAMKWIKKQLFDEFNMMNLGEAKVIIGWEITRDLHTKKLKINQKAYIKDLLESEGMSSCHPTVLPMNASSTIPMNQAGDDVRVDLTSYQRLVGKLIYLVCGTRPNIAFVVGQLSRHNSDPRSGHLRVAKQVLRYLKETITLGIVWGNDLADHLGKYPPQGIVGYANSNFARDPEDRKSVTGY